MTIEFNLVKNILDTLPIGYYLGRNIKVVLVNSDKSYFIPSEDVIHIGYQMIANAFNVLSEEDKNKYDIEEIIRGLLYHEISHVILTPDLYSAANRNHDIINVFEDERIETVFKSFYMNTNFRKNLIFLNKLDENVDMPITNAYNAFYSVVRFHKGKREFIVRASKIISRYACINASTTTYIIYDYVKAILQLYDDIAKDFKNNKEQYQQPTIDGKVNNDDGNSESGTSNSGDDNFNDLTDDEINSIINELNVEISNRDIEKIIKVALAATVNSYYDPQLSMRLAQLIEKKLKNKSNIGAAINSYSGRLDVRSIAKRDDYKWWSQQNRAGHIKAYSKVHFNLYLDNSGSFKSNDDNMNKFIQSLCKITNNDFDFDIITINTRVVEWSSPTDKLFKSGGGTHLPDHIKNVIKKHTLPRVNNYNIVLFDGDASPDFVGGSNAFRYFDTPNTIIVTDSSNKKYTDSAIKQAKVITTSDYCNKFIDAILTLMDQVL